MKNVLILGAGLVSRPIVRYLLERTDRTIVVASRTVAKAEALIAGHPRGKAVAVNVDNEAQVESLVKEAEIVVSLVPYTHHVAVTKLALRHRAHVVTTSYVSPAMRELDGPARQAGVALLNEIGLDPGIDHMSAMQVIHQIQRSGGTVTHFSSCCGGFPAPEANTNPWGYKFSWSPRGVMMAGRNNAKYLKDGKVVDIPGPELFLNRWPYGVEGTGLFEIYPNRDSLGYIDVYGLQGVRNMFRGTIRYPGWCETLKAIADLGLLDLEEVTFAPGTTYSSFMARFLPAGSGSIAERLAKRLGIEVDHDILKRLEWAGLLSDRPLPEGKASPLDVLSNRLQKVMTYRSGERDMIVLRHEFVASWPGRPSARTVCLLVDYGQPFGDSSMARTVSLPAAIAVRLMLLKKLDIVGVHIPVEPEIYEPVLAELAALGVQFKETSHLILPGPFESGR
jgi:saccharopine dehydrogenase-like NADP-dependent oxidoreductase